jgi:uridine kinase
MKPFFIGVAGGSGSGKSTVTDHIVSAIGPDKVSVINQDCYYKNLAHISFEERCLRNMDHPDSFDWELLLNHIENLSNSMAIEMPEYDFTTHTRKASVTTILPAKVVIIEGLFPLYDENLAKKMALRVFVDTAADIRLMRRLKRDIAERGRTLESVLTQYYKFVRPMYRKFIEPTKRLAHIIIPHGSNQAALEMIVSRIHSVLNGQQFFSAKELFFEDDEFGL